MNDTFVTRRTHTVKTTALLAGLAAILVATGGLFAGQGGMLVALVVAAVLDLGAWWFIDSPALKALLTLDAENRAQQGRRRLFPGRGGARPAPVPAATAHLSTVSPLSVDGLGSLSSTHPPIPERVRRLRGPG